MTKRIKRHQNFEISLQITSDAFIRPPRETQRNWFLSRAIKELSDDLLALDRQARHFIKGAEVVSFKDKTQQQLSSQEIMEDWQRPVMQAMATAVARSHGDILEIGFGRGVASSFLQAHQPESHTVMECNLSLLDSWQTWKKQYPGRKIRLVPGLWQDSIGQLGQFDGIFFHTYPLNEREYIEQVVHSVTFAEHFFPEAAKHLKPGGCFTYLSNEWESLSRGHQRLLFRYFSSFTLSRVEDLNIPENSRDVQWSDAMVIVKAVK